MKWTILGGHYHTARLRGFKLSPLTIATCAVKCARRTHSSGLKSMALTKVFLRVDTWRQITEDLRRHHIEFDHIIFQWLGDPSLHPQLPELVALAVKNIGTQVDYLPLIRMPFGLTVMLWMNCVPSAHRVQCLCCSFLPLMPAPPRSMKRSKVVRTMSVHW